MDGPAIDLQNVVKIYRRRVHALQGVSLHVNRGEVFGLLGPNGAGKSTLVKIMMTVVRPTRAEGSLLGRPIGHKPTLARVGYLPENHRFPRYLTGRQVLEFFAALAKVDRVTRKKRASELLQVVGMAQWADTKIATYSKGMLQRIGLAQALVHDPDLVVLDEPTDGVDPLGRRDILDVLGQLRGRGKTIFVNSHALSELETICNRVAILVSGQVARQGSIDELTVAKQRYEIEVFADGRADLRRAMMAAVGAQWKPSSEPLAPHAPPPLPAVAPPRPDQIGTVAVAPSRHRAIDRGTLGELAVEWQAPVLRIGTTDPAQVQEIIDAMRRAGLIIRRVQQVRPSLEDLFLDTVADPKIARAPRTTERPALSRQGGTP